MKMVPSRRFRGIWWWQLLFFCSLVTIAPSRRFYGIRWQLLIFCSMMTAVPSGRFRGIWWWQLLFFCSLVTIAPSRRFCGIWLSFLCSAVTVVPSRRFCGIRWWRLLFFRSVMTAMPSRRFCGIRWRLLLFFSSLVTVVSSRSFVGIRWLLAFWFKTTMVFSSSLWWIRWSMSSCVFGSFGALFLGRRIRQGLASLLSRIMPRLSATGSAPIIVRILRIIYKILSLINNGYRLWSMSLLHLTHACKKKCGYTDCLEICVFHGFTLSFSFFFFCWKKECRVNFFRKDKKK